jgi:hypothetical protein
MNLKLDSFTQAYITCALWSSNDESNESGGNPMDQNYSPEDIAPECLARIVEDCKQFQADNAELLSKYTGEFSAEQAGHDFWLSRNGHGAGFFDRVSNGHELEETCDKLQEIARKFGEFDLYIGDDGKIYA